MLDDTPTAYVWETKSGLYLVEANEDLLFFRALRAVRSARTVGELREADARLGLGLWEGWYDLWSVFPSDEDSEHYDQWSDDSEQLHHWRDHPATGGFAFELGHEDMPRGYNEWLPEEVVETLYDWMADEYRVKQSHAAQARVLLEQHRIRLVDEPALADVFEAQS